MLHLFLESPFLPKKEPTAQVWYSVSKKCFQKDDLKNPNWRKNRKRSPKLISNVQKIFPFYSKIKLFEEAV